MIVPRSIGNWCELSLRKLGNADVFCYVGDEVLVNTPWGPAPPLVTGTFGGADFLHSLLGEATESVSLALCFYAVLILPSSPAHSHLSEASVTDLTQRMSDAKTQDSGDSAITKLRNILSMLPVGSADSEAKLQDGEDIRASAINFDPNTVAPAQARERLWNILKWRDGMMKDIAKVIGAIPGLESLLDQFSNALNVCRCYFRILRLLFSTASDFFR